MSADFWAGYISGAVGIIIGNPLDVLKVKLQAGVSSSSPPSPPPSPSPSPTPSPTTSCLRPFLTGTAAPVLGYGALNALLFVSYNRTEAALNSLLHIPTATGSNLATTWLAGAVGGLATWVVSTPTELVKCRAQLGSVSPAVNSGSGSSSLPAVGGDTSTSAGSRSGGGGGSSSWAITRHVLRTEGLRGLYLGGAVTALRDSVGYGFYFWSYELAGRCVDAFFTSSSPSLSSSPPPPPPYVVGAGVRSDIGPGLGASTGGWQTKRETAKVLLCGGIAGIVTWASIFPLDVIKTRVQTQGILSISPSPSRSRSPSLSLSTEPGRIWTERDPLLPSKQPHRLTAWEVVRQTYREGGVRPFFRGLLVCSVRAFVVNAVQWAVYEWIMTELGQGRRVGGREERGEETGSW